MTGYPDANSENFLKASDKLSEMGYEAVYINITGDDYAANHGEHQKKMLMEMLTCGSVFFLSGWETSKGAIMQNTVAQTLGMDLYYETNMDWKD